MTDCSSTLDTIRTLYVSNRANEVLSLAASSWSNYTSCPDVGAGEAILLGEAMRIASIAARGNGDPAGAAVWLSRARALFARGGSDTGIALTMLVDVYDALDRHGPGSTALAMLGAAEWAVGEAPEPMLREDVLALVAEKRAFVLLEQAGRGRDTAGLDAARREYQRALTFVKSDPRRRLKLQAAIISVDVFSSTISVGDAIARLERLLDEADLNGLGSCDVAPRLRENLQRLRSGRSDLQSYETFAVRT
jgi:hypothetical protein